MWLHTALRQVITMTNTSILNLDYTLQSLKKLKKITDSHPRDSDLIGLGYDLSIWIFKGSQGDSLCILRLKVTKAYIVVMIRAPAGFISWLCHLTVGLSWVLLLF